MGTVPIESGVLLILFALQILAGLFACRGLTTRNPSSEVLAWMTALNSMILFDAIVYIAFYNKRNMQVIHPTTIVFATIHSATAIFLSTTSDMTAAVLVFQITALPIAFALISYMFMQT
jgi:hypothetical protein